MLDFTSGFTTYGNIAISVAGTGGQLSVTNSSDSDRGFIVKTGTNKVILGTNSAIYGLEFVIDSVTKAMIDTNGNFMVGTTSVLSYAKVGISFNGTTSNAIVMNDSVSSNGAGYAYFQIGGTTIGSITRVGTGSTVSYATSSDYRLKENVQPMTGALAVVQQLKPCTYTWKADGSDGQGFIAHELAEVCPDAVVGEKDAVNEDGSIKAQGIDTSFLVATLTAAIQEQQAMIEQLRADVAALKA